MKEHRLKTWPGYFEAVESGGKNFEVRRDDRGFQKGDVLRLDKWSPDQGYFFDRRGDMKECVHVDRRVTWILTGGQFGIEAGYVVMGLAEVDKPE